MKLINIKLIKLIIFYFDFDFIILLRDHLSKTKRLQIQEIIKEIYHTIQLPFLNYFLSLNKILLIKHMVLDLLDL